MRAKQAPLTDDIIRNMLRNEDKGTAQEVASWFGLSSETVRKIWKAGSVKAYRLLNEQKRMKAQAEKKQWEKWDRDTMEELGGGRVRYEVVNEFNVKNTDVEFRAWVRKELDEQDFRITFMYDRIIERLTENSTVISLLAGIITFLFVSNLLLWLVK